MSHLTEFPVAVSVIEDGEDISNLYEFEDNDFEYDNYYNIEASAKDVGMYYDSIIGLFYSLCIREVMAQRYRILYKLGYGGFGTVWMAHDLLGKKNVALKVMVSRDGAKREYAMQNEIMRTVKDTSGLVIY
jgi:serine/threonine protein kinase